MTVVVPLSAFLTLILVFCLSSLMACRSLKGRLFLGVMILTSASCVLTSYKYVSNATDGWIGGSQFDLTWKGCGSLL